MLNIPFAPGVGDDRFIPKSSKNVDGRPVVSPDRSDFPSVFSSFGAALFESSLTLFLAFFKRRSMAAMESSSSSDSSSVDDDDDDAASILMRIVVPFFVLRVEVVAKLVVVVFLPEKDLPFEDEEKAEETRLCASRDDREEDVRANIITSRIMKTILENIEKEEEDNFFYTKGGKNSSRCAHPPSIDSRRTRAVHAANSYHYYSLFYNNSTTKHPYPL